MRIGFAFIVLFGAFFAYRFLDNAAIASPEVLIERSRPAMDIGYETAQAGAILNSIREEMHMQRLSSNIHLEAAAQAHADYLVHNNESSHDEVAGHQNFTGVKPLDRTLNAGYNASYVSENLSTKNSDAKSSVNGLFSAIYHRFGFLSPSIDELGVGVTQDDQNTQNSAFVYVMGNSEMNRLCSMKSFSGFGKYVFGVCREKAHRIAKKKFDQALDLNKMNNPEIILYPYNGQIEVPPAFYAEVPDPLPNHDVSGFPVSIEFNDYFFKEVILYSFELLKENVSVPNVLFMDKNSDPHMRFTDKQFALFPLERLEYDKEYTAVVTYSRKGKNKEIRWSFRTKKPTEELHIITQKEESISIESGKSHVIYFKPLDAHDIVKNVQFPSTVDIEFIDNNTFKLTINNKSNSSFDIVSDSRVLHLNVNSQ